MCDIPNDIAMDANTGETPAMDRLQAEKVDALQSEPSVEEAVKDSTVAGASQASQSRSQVENKSRVARRTGRLTQADTAGAHYNMKAWRCVHRSKHGDGMVQDWPSPKRRTENDQMGVHIGEWLQVRLCRAHGNEDQ